MMRWPTLPTADDAQGGRIDAGLFGLLLFGAATKPRRDAPAQRIAERRAPRRRPARPKRGSRSRSTSRRDPGDVRIQFHAISAPPYHYELTLREMGVSVWGQRIHAKLAQGGVHASLVVSRRQKKWAEEILFIQGHAAPAVMAELDPATARKIQAGKTYTPAHKWQATTRRPVGLKGRIIDFIGRFHGFTPRDGSRDLSVAPRGWRRG